MSDMREVECAKERKMIGSVQWVTFQGYTGRDPPNSITVPKHIVDCRGVTT